MDSTEEANFIPFYQSLLFQDSNSAIEEADLLRKRLTHTYSSGLKLLNNENLLDVLDLDLRKYSDICKKIDQTMPAHRNVSSDHQSKTNQWHSNLGKVDLRTLLTPLPCSNDVLCEKIQHINDETVQEFAKMFSSTSDSKLDFSNESKTRRIAKSFAPQCCSKHVKTSSVFSLPVEEKCVTSTSKNESKSNAFTFKTARDELEIQNSKKFRNSAPHSNQYGMQQPTVGLKRKLGTRRNVQNKFISPMLASGSSEELSPRNVESSADEMIDERLKNIEPKMVELIRSEIMDCGTAIDWNDIAGLEFAKTAIQEAVIWPLLRPDIFTGLRRPPKGILLFGPPGTGKTLIGKCVASQSKSTFFSISASSLTSKWIGDGEKMVRALFAVARCHQPAVIFIDEIDSLLSQRSDSEHESSRRIKTEFLIQLDGATTDNEERLLLIGATNRPQELDEAARRRFVKRLYIPLPDFQARLQLMSKLMSEEQHDLNDEHVQEIATRSEGYSGADVKNLCSEACLGPIRCIDINMIQSIQSSEVRPVNMGDFIKALDRVKSSVSPDDLNQYVIWNKTYGSGSGI